MPFQFGTKDESSILRFRQQLSGAIERSKNTELQAIEADKQRQIDMAISEHLSAFKQADDGTFQNIYTAGKQTVPKLLELGPRGVVAAKEIADYVNIYPKPREPRETGTKFDWVSQIGASDKVEYQSVPGMSKKQPVLKKVIVGDDGTMKDTGARKLAGAIGESAGGDGGGFNPDKTKIQATWSYRNAKGDLVEHPLVGTPRQISASLQSQKENLRKNILSEYPFDLKAIKQGDVSSIEKFQEAKNAEITTHQEMAARAKSELERIQEEGGDQSEAYKGLLKAKEALDVKIQKIRDFVDNGITAAYAWRSAVQQEAAMNEMGGGVGIINPNVGPKPVQKSAGKADAAPTTSASGTKENPFKVSTIEERDKLDSGVYYIGPDGKTRRRK